MSDLDIYQRITNRIIAALEAGTAPWVQPWSGMADPVPRNYLYQKPYRGINTLVLDMVAQDQGYDTNTWLTFRQARSLGGQVRKGEHGTPIVFWQFKDVPEETEPDEQSAGKRRCVPLVRVYTVFNLNQVEGIAPMVPAPTMWNPEELAEEVLLHSGAQIRHLGYRAFYSSTQDWIYLPPQRLFQDAASYYGTALHELTHWTGHASRLGRKLGNRFGSEAYAMEELVAELGSAFLCAHCRIDGHLQHAAYIDSWLEVLRKDKRAVFVAAAQAQKATDYLLDQLNPAIEEDLPMAA
jgi:antirestriction protein ArdC